MSRAYRCWKYQGTGNDFLLAYASEGEVSSEEVQRLCDRRTGIGADGLIRVLPGGVAVEGFLDLEAADFGLDLRNADGSIAEMSGNGIRCLAAFAIDRGLTSATELRVATRVGVKVVTVAGEGASRLSTVDMGPPRFERMHIPMHGAAWETFMDQPVESEDLTVVGTAVSMGNPHLVLFATEGAAPPRVEWLGPRLEHHPWFPERTNVEFVLPAETDGVFPARVWERGVGETLACGTGACAIIAAAHATGRSGPEGIVRFPGGDLHVKVDADGIELTGPALEVFEGSIEL